MKFIISILLNGLAVFMAAKILDGVAVAGFLDAVIVGVVLGLINTFVKPIISFLALPISVLTLGLFTLIINGGLILFADSLLDGFVVNGLVVAILFSILLTVLNYILGFFSK
ncbi:MAG: phage holin family protein [Chitinophagales bacterium]